MSQDNFYAEHYQSIVNAGAVGLVSKHIHKLLEPKRKTNFNVVLEVGAGHGQHFEFVKHGYSQYFETDIRKQNLPLRLQESKVVSLSSDASNLIEFKKDSVDRVIATCLIVHLTDPESALKEWRRVCREGGLISIYVPCEPGLILRLLRQFTTVRKGKKLGLNHLSFHYREHITFFSRINLLIMETFQSDRISKKYWPFSLHSWNLNLGVIYQIDVLKKSD